MSTGQELLDDKKFLESQGYGYAELSKDRSRGTWYRPDGLAIPGLPTDVYHRTLYRKRGWTLVPPKNPVVMPEDAAVDTEGTPGKEWMVPHVLPPKHIHVMLEAVGSPCLVQGCTHSRLGEKVTVTKRNPRSKKEKVNAR